MTVDGAADLAQPDVYRTLGLVTEREAVHGFLTGWQFVLASAKLHRLPDPDGAARRALALVEMDRRAGPPDRDLLQGHAAAHPGRRRARARPAGAAAGRAVQRHGPAPAACT